MIEVFSEPYENTAIWCEDSWNYHGHTLVPFRGNSLDELKAFIAEHEDHVQKEY